MFLIVSLVCYTFAFAQLKFILYKNIFKENIALYNKYGLRNYKKRN